MWFSLDMLDDTVQNLRGDRGKDIDKVVMGFGWWRSWMRALLLRKAVPTANIFIVVTVVAVIAVFTVIARNATRTAALSGVVQDVALCIEPHRALHFMEHFQSTSHTMSVLPQHSERCSVEW